MMGAATEKARLPMFSLVLGIESCCEVDDHEQLYEIARIADEKISTLQVILMSQTSTGKPLPLRQTVTNQKLTKNY